MIYIIIFWSKRNKPKTVVKTSDTVHKAPRYCGAGDLEYNGGKKTVEIKEGKKYESTEIL